MDDVHEINVAKTELREAYNTGDVDRLLAIYAPWASRTCPRTDPTSTATTPN